MRAFDDFEVLLPRQESRFWRPGMARPVAIEATPEAKVHFWNLPDCVFHGSGTLFYRGAIVPHIRPHGDLIWPQFEFVNGFLFFTQHVEDMFEQYTHIFIYYVGKDFLTADGCGITPDWWGYRPDSVDAQAGSLGLPISYIGVRRDTELVFNVERIGWIRLTVTIPPPKWRFALLWDPFPIFPRQARHFRLSKATAEDGLRSTNGYVPEPREAGYEQKRELLRSHFEGPDSGTE